MWVLIAAISVLLVAFILSLASMRRKTPLVWRFPGRASKYRTSATPPQSQSSTPSPQPPSIQYIYRSPSPLRYYFNHSDFPPLRRFPERRCTTRLTSSFDRRFLKRCDTVKAGRICWLQVEEEERLARLKRQLTNDPQRRLAAVLHSSLHALSPGRPGPGMPIRRRLAQVSQSQPDLSNRSHSFLRSGVDSGEFSFTALWWLN